MYDEPTGWAKQQYIAAKFIVMAFVCNLCMQIGGLALFGVGAVVGWPLGNYLLVGAVGCVLGVLTGLWVGIRLCYSYSQNQIGGKIENRVDS